MKQITIDKDKLTKDLKQTARDLDAYENNYALMKRQYETSQKELKNVKE